MKKYKAVDFYLQVFSLIMIGLSILINQPEKINPVVFIFIFALLQIISILLHFFTGLQTWKKSSWRRYHLIGTVVVLILLIIAFIQDAGGRSHDKDDKYGMPGLEMLIWATIPAIVLSLFYVIITWQEWRNIKQRQSIQLK